MSHHLPSEHEHQEPHPHEHHDQVHEHPADPHLPHEPAEGQPGQTPTPPPAVSPPISHAAIAARAYQRFVARGRQNGHDLDDWLQAERELRSEQQHRLRADG